MITLLPPRNKALFKAIKLHSGTTYHPDFSKGGQVKVATEEDARELESENWTRDAASAKSAKFDSDLLRKGMAAAVRRQPGVGDIETTSRDNTMQMAEFNVTLGTEKIRVKRGDRVIVVAGIEIPLGELAPQVQREFAIATAKLDGASFDIDGDLVNLGEARRAIEAAIVAVMGDKAFRDRLITAGTRRAK
jgi:hypothetical protein